MKDEIELVVGAKVVRLDGHHYMTIHSIFPFKYVWSSGAVGGLSMDSIRGVIDHGQYRIQYPKSYYIKKFFND